MKICKECKQEKLLTDYSVDKTMKDNLRAKCRECRKTESSEWYRKNKEKRNTKSNEYYQNNKDKLRVCHKKWHEDNKDHFNLYKKEYISKNKGRVSSYWAKRRAKKLKATPAWLSKEQLEEIAKIYETRPEGYHVDHIIPLQGENVCGLHVPWNLQHLIAAENCKKNNKLDLSYLEKKDAA